MKINRMLLMAVSSAFLLVSCGNGLKPVVPFDDSDEETQGFKEDPIDPSADPSGIFNYASLMEQDHPRVLMNETDWAALREHAKTNEVTKKFNDMMIKYADDLVAGATDPLKYQIVDHYLVYVAWNASARILYCSYAYRMTGDKKYLEKVEKDLQAICLFPDWYPSHYLGTAELALAAGIGYDWCYQDLSYVTRKMVRKALEIFAFGTYEEQKVNKRTNNWYPVCFCGLSVAALATYEHNKEISARVMDTAVQFNPPAMQASYAPDGIYPEGYNYWGYGTMTESVMLTAFQRAFGHDAELSASKGWDKTADFIMYMVGMNGQSFNYSDCGPGLSPKVPMWYFASTLNRPELITTELKMLNDGLYPTSAEWRYLPLGMKWVDSVDCSAVKYPDAKVWSGGGEVPMAMVHTDWTWSETDKYLAFKGGKSDAPHGHMDSGTFVYDAFGQRWADDIGPEEYAPLEALFESMGGKFFAYDKNSLRWTCFRLNDKSHNTITVNGNTHNPDGIALLTKVYNEEPYGGDLDMTPPLSEEVAAATRQFRLAGDVLSITDSFTAKAGKPAQISWHMATMATVTLEADRIKLEKGGKTVYLTVEGAGATLKVYPAEGIKEYDTPNPGYTMIGWDATVAGGASASFTTRLQP